MKNILKLTSILILFIAFNINAFGQQFGIKASGGISRIYGSLGTDNFSWPQSPMPPSSSSFSPSFQAGLYYLLPTGKNTSLGAELLYSKVQGKQSDDYEYYFNGQRQSYGTRSIYEDISWLSLPVYFGVTYKRLTINVGLQFSYLLSSSGSKKSTSVQNPIEPVGDDSPRPVFENNWNRELNNLDIKEVDFGPRAGFVYRLTNKLSMEGMFYYGLNNLNLLPSTEEELKVQQMTLGVKYALGTKDVVAPSLAGSKQFGIKAGGGVSKTTNSLDHVQFTTPIGMTEQYQYSSPFITSGQGGFYYNMQCGRKSYVGAELLFSQIEGNERREDDIRGRLLKVNGDTISIMMQPYDDKIHIENNHIRHISYLSLPIYYGYKINKWSINVGLLVNYALMIRESSQRNITVNDEPYDTYNKKLGVSIINLDFGPRAGIIYQLSDQLAVEGTYYYGLNDIRKREVNGTTLELKVQQMTVGIRYALWSLY